MSERPAEVTVVRPTRYASDREWALDLWSELQETRDKLGDADDALSEIEAAMRRVGRAA